MSGKKKAAVAAVSAIALVAVVFTALRFAGVWGSEKAGEIPVVEDATAVSVAASEEVVIVPEALPAITEEEDLDAETSENNQEVLPSEAFVPVAVSVGALDAVINQSSAEIAYPESISEGDIAAFIASEDEAYGLGAAGVSYVIAEPGKLVVSYPKGTDPEIVSSWLDTLYADAETYMSKPASSDVEENEIVSEPVPAAPVFAETEAESAVPSAPEIISSIVDIPVPEPVVTVIEEEEEEEKPEIRIIVKGGVSSGASADGLDMPSLNIGLGFEVGDIVSFGDVISMGLRTDFALDIYPPVFQLMTMPNGMPYAYYSPGLMASLDLKLMFDFAIGIGDVYLGAGAGGAIGNPSNSYIGSYLGSGSYSVGGYSFLLDWYVTAVAGIRFDITSWLSIGTEIDYRLMFGSMHHILSASLVLTARF